MSTGSRQTEYNALTPTTGTGYLTLQTNLLRICLLNFFLLSVIGLLLRAYTVFPVSFLSYKNVLHAHSHFAFGGCVMPILFLLILKYFPELCTASGYRHWRNSIVLALVSAYGMLLSFPFQGYGVVSIIFSTLSIVAGFYVGSIIRKACRQQVHSPSRSFLLVGFFYFFIAAIGPFATGPLIAMGKSGTPIYYNAIYFYLHFQYNGFFTFIVLAVLYKMFERNKPLNNGKTVFRLLNITCIPAYFLSVLWTQPSIIFYVVGGSAALLQLIAVGFLLQDVKHIGWKNDMQGWLFRFAILAFTVKIILQLLSAFPFIADLAYQNRNFVIAYLHLVLIGFISLFVFAALLKNMSPYSSRMLNNGIRCFLFAFVTTELLLVAQAAGLINLPDQRIYFQLLFALSTLFPVGLLMIFTSNERKNAWRSYFNRHLHVFSFKGPQCPPQRQHNP